MMMHPFLVPLSVLAALAALLAGHGAAAIWSAETGARLSPLAASLIAVAVQGACVAALMTRRVSVALPTWLTTLVLSHAGLVAKGFADGGWTVAALLQGLVWLLARGLHAPEPLAERLARWRRVRAAFELQVTCVAEVIAGLRASVGRLLRGAAEVPPAHTEPLPAATAANLEHALTSALDIWIAEIDGAVTEAPPTEATHVA